MKIGTFNICHAANYPKFRVTGEEFIEFDTVAEQIAENRVEICALNEVRRQDMLEGGFDQAKEIAGQHGYHFCFANAYLELISSEIPEKTCSDHRMMCADINI